MIANICELGSRDQIAYLVEHGVIEILIYHVEKTKIDQPRVVFDALQNLVNLIDPQIEDIITKKCLKLKGKIFKFFSYYLNSLN